jgi:hypothetical protein
MNNEHLWRELSDAEREDDARFRQNRAMDELRKAAPKPIDHDAAIARFHQDFEPMFRRREKARTSLAYRLFLKATGQWQQMDPGSVEVVNTSKGLVLVGPSVEDVQKEIAANPAAYKHLAKSAPQVGHVQAERRTIEPKLANEPRDDT